MKIREKIKRTVSASFTLVILALFFAARSNAQVSPFQGLGQAQFFDNSGAVLTNGVLYSYQAGTSTQQATYTDSTGTTQNVNPVTFGSGARAQIWLTTASFYKFVLCSQNDGAFCAAGDILFSVDNVPGGATSSGGGGGSPFTGIFISSTATPATSGILRLASGDSICWRNAAGSTNLCFKKDSNDLLSWDGGSFKLPEVAAPSAVATFDILWADNTAHRFMMKNNGGSATQVVASGVDINTSDQVTQLHFGATATPLSAVAPTANQLIGWDGAHIVGVTSVTPSVFSLTSNVNAGAGLTNITGMSFAVLAGTNYRLDCKLFMSAGAGTTNLTWTGPAAPTLIKFGSDSFANGFSASFGTVQQVFSGVSAQVLVPQFMSFINGVNAGTVQLQTDNNSIVYAGSFCAVINQ